MQYPKRRLLPLIALALLSAAPGCAPKERIQPLFPNAEDVKAVTAPKPVATIETVTSAEAAARYNVEVEMWGDGLRSAGGRICRWIINNGGALPFACPTPEIAK